MHLSKCQTINVQHVENWMYYMTHESGICGKAKIYMTECNKCIQIRMVTEH